MKIAFLAVLVVLAFGNGAESVSLVKRDLSSEIERMSKYLQDLSASMTSTAQDVAEKLRNHELTGRAQTFLEEKKAELQPLAEQVQAQAELLRVQLTPYVASIEAQVRPVADTVQAQVQARVEPLLASVQAQVKPLADDFQAKVEEIYKMMVDQSQAMLAN